MLGIDFDETLSLSKGKDLLPNNDLIDILKEEDFVIITARRSTDLKMLEIVSFIKEHDLHPIDIIFTEGKAKGPFIKEYGIKKLVDDKEYQRKSAKTYGAEAVSPEEFIKSKQKIKRMSFFKNIFKIIKGS